MLDLGVPEVWAKAISLAHARVLTQIGVHHVARPEHDVGKRVAHLVRGGMVDYIELDDGYAFVKTKPSKPILNKKLSATTVRRDYGITVVGIKRGSRAFPYATPDTVVVPGDVIIISGDRAQVERFAGLA